MAIKFLNSVNADSGVLYVDAANDKVGIGTTSPETKLQVNGAVYSMLGLYSDHTYSSNRNWRIVTNSFGAGNWGGLAIKTSNSAGSTPNTTRFGIDYLGNVGIGTTSPDNKLTIVDSSSKFIFGDVNGDARIGLDGANGDFSGQDYTTLTSGVNGDFTLQVGASGKTIFRRAATEQMRIDSSGNVGIGTTSPSSKLEVKGASGTVYDTQFKIVASEETGAADTGGSLSFIGHDGNVGRTHAAVRGLKENSTVGDYSGYLSFDTRANSATLSEKMRILGNGNVGIGTTNPSYKLEVNGKIATPAGAIVIQGQEIYANSEYSGNDGSVRINRFGYLGGQTKFRDTVIYDGKGSQILTVDGSTSRVGIGTTSPSHTLDVNGELRVGTVVPQTSADFSVRRNGANIEFGHGNRTSGYYGTIGVQGNNGMPYIALSADCESSVNTFTTRGFKGNVITTDGAGSLMFSQLTTANATGQSLTERMRIDSAGNVGIGGSPASVTHGPHLDIVGNRGTLTVGTGYFEDNGTTNFLNGARPLAFGYAGTEHMRVHSNGNVGVGTASPTEKLHVSGDVRIEGDLTVNGSYTQIDTDVNTTEQWNVTNDGTGPAVTINQTGAQDIMDVQDDGTSVFYIEDGGNVGIGTTNPDSTLHVSSSSPIITISNSDTSIVDEQVIGQIDFKSLDGSTNMTNVFGSIRTEAEGTLDNGVNDGGKMVFSTFKQSTTLVDQMVIDRDGNVGIGTTSPVTKLHTVGEIVSGTTGFSSGMIGFTGLGSYNSSLAVENIDALYLRKGGTNGSSTSIALASASGNSYFVGSRIKFIRTGSNSKGHLAFETKGDTSVNTTSERMRITDSGNVGIGTTSPTLSPTSYTGGLHVENDTYIQARLSSSSSGAGLEFIPSSGDHWEIQAQTGNSLIFYNRTDSSYRMVIDGGGNIGVGITSPAAKMHIGPAALVSGYTTTRTTLAVSDTTNGAELILRGQSPRIWLDATAGGDGEIYMDGTNLVVYAGNPTSAGDSRFSIDSSGNIRFAAYTAGYLKSDASGNITVDNSTFLQEEVDTLASVTARGATTSTETYFNNTVNLNSSGVSLQFGSSTDGSSYNPVESTVATERYWLRFDTTDDASFPYLTNRTPNGAVVIKTGTAAGGAENEHFRIKGGDGIVDAYFTDVNLGIGTDSPANKLEVRGSIGIERSNAAATSTIDMEGNFIFNAANGYNYKFRHNGTDLVHFDQNGNVGIGTTNPNEKLTIVGDATKAKLELLVTGNTGESQIHFGDDDDVNSGRIAYNHASDYMSFYTNNVGDRMIINSSGNVGIGTTSPGAKLQLGDYPSNNIDITTYPDVPSEHMLHLTAPETTNRYGGGISFGENHFTAANITVQDAGGNGSLHMLFGTRHTSGIVQERMRITSDGNVGIGTTDPENKLHILSSTTDATQQLLIQNGSTGDAAIKFNISGDTYSLGIDNSDGDKFKLSAGNLGTNDRIVVDSSGNVGIGASSPLRKLHVVGNFAVNAGTGEYYGVNITGGEGANPTILIGDWHNASANLSWDSTNRLLRIDAQYSTNGAPIVFSGNDAAIEYGRFTATGNFGIGTTDPGDKLTVNGKILLENSGTPIFTLKDTGNSGGGGASGIIRFKNNAGDAIGIGYTSNDTTTSDLLISTNAASTYGGYLGLDANAITDPSSIILDPKTSVIINGDAVIGEHRIIDLPSFNMGAGSVTDEYLVVCKQAPSGGGVVASGIQGRISFSRGSDGSYNNSHYIDINIQMSLDSGSVNTLDVTQFELYRDSSNPFFSQLEEIDIDGTKYVALKARSSGGGSVNHFYFEGSISDASDTNILSRVRASDSAVTVTDPQPTGLPITPYITKNQDGNVGIGISSPTYKLDVAGNLRINEGDAFTDFDIKSDRTSGNIGGVNFVNASDAIKGQVYGHTDGSVRIASGGTSVAMALSPTGMIGIGTTNPLYSLELRNAYDGGNVIMGYYNTSNIKKGFIGVVGTAGDFIDDGAVGDFFVRAQQKLHLSSGTAGDYQITVDTDGSVQFSAYGAGYLKTDSSGNISVDTSTIEDTLDSVTDRGATTTNDIEVGNITTKNDSGIYSFSDTVNASASEDIFSISNDHGAQAFRVTFVCSTSSYSVAKTYEVVHAFGQDPVFFKVVDTGAFGDHDFDASFATEAGGLTNNNKKIICTITNNSTTINADIVTTVFLGGSPTAITVTAL